MQKLKNKFYEYPVIHCISYLKDKFAERINTHINTERYFDRVRLQLLKVIVHLIMYLYVIIETTNKNLVLKSSKDSFVLCVNVFFKAQTG